MENCLTIVSLWASIIAACFAGVSILSAKSQFKKSMKAQERSINVSLLDQRTEILVSVTNNKPFSRTKAALLFDVDINDLIERFDSLCSDKMRLEQRLRDYRNMTELTWYYSQLEAEQFLDDLAEYSRLNPGDPRHDELGERIAKIKLFDRYQISEDEYETVEWPSYLEVQNLLYETEGKIDAIHKQITQKMGEFISNSISI